ncbi:OmpH family outer membrane protein [Geomonas paludis]|uniref:OmpH family outer membrane protein n=1 Tax=Geomonas paludis TaxID=2740185 RepID=A0A6V8N0W2_9BACT|nr:OmpH family outer membrane protein [Geomonas paludis]UPU36858.1 OmpH family outer membrane protein [Geomonas paludis]GFO65527.1 OmpH outer membrane protein [Geomonas paludis]
MKRFIVAISLVLALPLSVMAADGSKIGSVDIQKVLSQSDAGKEAKDQLMQKASKYEAEKAAKEADLLKLKGELESQGTALLNESARSAKDRDYQKGMKEYQRFLKDAQDDLQLKNGEYTNKILDEIGKVVQEFGRKSGYTAIFSREMMVYIDPSADVTDQVLKAFNESRKK